MRFKKYFKIVIWDEIAIINPHRIRFGETYDKIINYAEKQTNIAYFTIEEVYIGTENRNIRDYII